jgi:hypothetical protein
MESSYLSKPIPHGQENRIAGLDSNLRPTDYELASADSGGWCDLELGCFPSVSRPLPPPALVRFILAPAFCSSV